MSLRVKLPFWASPLSSVRIWIPTLQGCVKEHSRGSERCGCLTDISFLFFLSCSFVSLSGKTRDITIFKWYGHYATVSIYSCVLPETSTGCREERGPLKWKYLKIFFSLQVRLNSLRYPIFQASSSPAVGLEAHPTDRRTWSSTISFSAFVASRLYILSFLYLSFVYTTITSTKGKARSGR